MAEAIPGAADSAPALLIREAVAIRRTCAVGADACARLVWLGPGADLTTAAALAVAARGGGAAFPATDLLPQAAITTAVTVETDFVRPAAEVIGRV